MKKNLLFLGLLCFFCHSFNSFGQHTYFDKLFNKIHHYDSAYIEDMSQRLSVRMVGVQKGLSFKISNANQVGQNLEYQPNTDNSLGIGIIYRDLGAEITFRVSRLSEEDIKEKGITKYLDIQFNLYGVKRGIDLNLQLYEGLYVSNPSAALRNYQAINIYPQRPDLFVMHSSLNYYYVANHRKFSFPAAFIQTRRQKKSAGSFIFMGSAGFVYVKADSGLSPQTQTPDYFGRQSHISQANFYNLAPMPGYAHSFIYKNLFLTATITAGFGPQIRHYQIGNNVYDKFGFHQRLNFRAAMGFNSYRTMMGISTVEDYTRMRIGESIYRTRLQNLKLFVGYRF